MRLPHHITTIDGAELIDGCRQSAYDVLVPGVRISDRTCDVCCCPGLSNGQCFTTPAQDCPPWSDGTAALDGFFGLAAETVDYVTGLDGTGTLNITGRFRAANAKSLQLGMRAYRRWFDKCVADCESDGLDIRVAQWCPDDCDPEPEHWDIRDLQLVDWTLYDDGTRSACIQPVSITWSTADGIAYSVDECTDGCGSTVNSATRGRDLPCSFAPCQTAEGDPCINCGDTVDYSTPTVYRGCWCQPLYRRATGLRIETPPGDDCWTVAVEVASPDGPSCNIQVVGWVAQDGLAPWLPNGADYYATQTPVLDLRIPQLSAGDVARLSPWDGATRTCQGTVYNDGVEGAFGGLATVADMQPGETLLLALYTDTLCDSGVELTATAHRKASF